MAEVKVNRKAIESATITLNGCEFESLYALLGAGTSLDTLREMGLQSLYEDMKKERGGHPASKYEFSYLARCR